MTNGEYIKEKLSMWSVSYSDAMIELELARTGVVACDTITGESNFDLFFYNVIPGLLSAPSSISEGGYSVSFSAEDKKAISAYYSLMAKQLGKPNLLSENTITDITNRW